MTQELPAEMAESEKDTLHGTEAVGQTPHHRGKFTGRMGFVLACVGSAVGMGNMWLFPYRVADLGGAAFLIPYFLFVALIGFTGVIGEMAFGRAMGSGPIGAFSKAMEMRGVPHGKTIGKILGVLPTIGILALAMGYAVVLGWACKYFTASLTGALAAVGDYGSFFGSVASDFGNVAFHLLGILITFAAIWFGVSRGIERLNKIFMPAFFILLIMLLVRVIMLPGSAEGFAYLFVPQWEALANPKTWVYALGQAFFSLSVVGCGTIVYGSYLNKREDIVKSARNVAVFDTIAALISAMVVVPAVFVFGLDLSSGPSLMFITLPAVFEEMPMGYIFQACFFLAVIFAAVTSLANMLESSVEALLTQFKMSRPLAILIVAIPLIGVGLFLENGNILGTWMDIISIYIAPLGALIAGIMFFWVCPKGFAREQASIGHNKELGRVFEFMGRYVFVGVTAAVLVLGVIYGGIG